MISLVFYVTIFFREKLGHTFLILSARFLPALSSEWLDKINIPHPLFFSAAASLGGGGGISLFQQLPKPSKHVQGPAGRLGGYEKGSDIISQPRNRSRGRGGEYKMSSPFYGVNRACLCHPIVPLPHLALRCKISQFALKSGGRQGSFWNMMIFWRLRGRFKHGRRQSLHSTWYSDFNYMGGEMIQTAHM